MKDGSPIPKFWNKVPNVMATSTKPKATSRRQTTRSRGATNAPGFKKESKASGYTRGGGRMVTGNSASTPRNAPDTPAVPSTFKSGKRIASGAVSPKGPGFEGKATHMGAKFATPVGRQTSTMDSPEVKGQMGSKNSTQMSPPSAFSKVKGFFTKKPTNQPSSEYEQIMADIQPKRKK